MKQDRRTKKQLIDELEALRRRLKDVEDSEIRHREAEGALRENEQRLRAILQGSPISAFVIGKDHRILYWNRALEELSKIKAQEVIGTNQHWRAFYSSERPCVADLIVDGNLDALPKWYADKYKKSDLLEKAFEATDFFPDLGERGRWLRFTAAAIRNEAGNLVGAIETLEDITERRRAEEELKDSEQQMRSVIQGSPIPTFVIGKDHRVIYWNRALEELSRISAADVIGTAEHWRAFYHSERPCMADLIVDEALETVPDWYSGKDSRSHLLDEAFEATDFFPDLGDEGRWLRFTATAIRNASGDLVGAIETLEDITERRRAEEELTRIRKLESLGLFADGVAQDFDGLLSAMLRNIFLAKISVPDEDKALEEILSTAEKAGLQAKELAHWLITFAKGGYPLRQVTPIAQVIREAVNSILSGSDIHCQFSIADDLWPSEVDEGQIRMAIQNIVLNACDSMPKGETIQVAAENMIVKERSKLPLKAGCYLKLCIRDQGVGIPKENLSRVFDPYFTTKDTKGKKGIGLGLAVCHSIVKNHRGLITLESEVGRGTTVHIFLPASPATAMPPTSGMQED